MKRKESKLQTHQLPPKPVLSLATAKLRPPQIKLLSHPGWDKLSQSERVPQQSFLFTTVFCNNVAFSSPDQKSVGKIIKFGTNIDLSDPKR